MNTVYRLVWNASLGIWTAVSEFAKARGKGKSGLKRAKGLASIALLSVTLVAIPGSANAWVVNPDSLVQSSKGDNAVDGGVTTNTAAGSSATAIGTNSTAIGADAIAGSVVGNTTYGSATAIGSAAKATGGYSLAAGFNATASGSNSVALGNISKATGSSSVALGNSSSAASYNSIAIGFSSKTLAVNPNVANSTVSLNYNMAVGNGAVASGFTGIDQNSANTTTGTGQATALGVSSLASGERSVALGSTAKATAGKTVAIGDNSEASAAFSFAGGVDSVASGINSTAVGPASNALGQLSTALGGGAKTSTAAQTTAVGATSEATAQYATAMGFNSVASGYYGLAAGSRSEASASGSTAIGSASKATTTNSTALGESALATGYSATALGQAISTPTPSDPEKRTQVTASGSYSLAVGSGANATSDNSIAIGSLAKSTGLATIAIGLSSSAAGTYSSAIGNEASTDGASSLAFGYMAQANTDAEAKRNAPDAATNPPTNSTAIGAQAQSATRSVALGTYAKANTDFSIAIGNNAQTIYDTSIAIGMESRAGHIAESDTDRSGGNSVGLGYKAMATGVSSTAIGANAAATKTGAVAVGEGAEATGYQSLALGAYSTKINEATGEEEIVKTSAQGNGSIALGAAVTATTANSVVIGTNSKSSGLSALAIGQEAESTGKTSVAIGGVATKALEHESVALGSYTVAKEEGATALGQSVVLTADGQRVQSTKDGAVRTATTASGKYSVALGSGVTSQAQDSIAIGTLSVADIAATQSIAVGLKSSTTAEDAIAMGTKAAAEGAQAVAIGASAKATAASATALGEDAKATFANATAVGAGAEALNEFAFAAAAGAIAGGLYSTAVGMDAQATGDNSLALGAGAQASHDNSVALGAGSVTAGAVGTGSVVVNDTEQQNIAGKYAAGTVSVGTGAEGGDRTITNVAAGRVSNSSTDAINGSQLQAVIDTPMLFAGNSGDVAKKLGEEVPLSIVGEEGAGGTYTGHNLRTAVDTDGKLQIQMTDMPEFTSVLVGSTGPGTGTTINSEGLAIAGGPSITTGGIDAAGNWISNVKAGEKDTDAVNVSQLNTLADTPLTFAANQGDDVKRKLGETMKIAGEGTTEGSYSAANIRTEMVGDDLIIKMAESPEFTSVLVGSSGPGTGITINSEGLAIAGGPSITTGGIDAAGNWISNVKAGEKDTDAVNVSQLNTLADTPLTFAANQGDDVKRKLGETMKIAGEGTTEGSYSAANIRTEMVGDDLIIKMAESPEFTSVLVGSTGPGTGTTINSEGLAIAGGPSITTGGIDAAGNWISNVKAGEKDTDAVNVSQLNTLADTPLTFAANQGDDVKRKLGETMKIAGEGTTEGSYSAANIRTEMVGDDLIIKMAESPEFTSVLVGSSGPGTGITINSEGLAIAGGPSITTGGIDAAGNWISNVKAGEKDTDAVNVSQLNTLADTPLTFAANQGDDVKRKLGETMKIAGEGTTEGSYSAANIRTEMVGDDLIIKMAESPEFTSVLVGSSGPGTGITINSEGLAIAGGPSITTGGIDAAGNWISNVKAGEKDTDAVNVSQLNTLADTPLTFAANQGDDVKRKLGETMKIAGEGTTEGSYSAANIRTEMVGDDLIIKMAESPEFTSVLVGSTGPGTGITINSEGLAIAGGPSITTGGIDAAGNWISNVKAGEKDTDAVNVSQLNTLADTPLTFAANQGDDVKRKLGETMKIAGEGTTEGSYSAANIRTEMVGDDLIIKMAESPEFTSVLVGSSGPGTGITINSEGLAIAGGPSITTGGIDAAGNWISNVKAGEKDTDAVNVSQLNTLADTPLTFAANQGDDVKRKLGETMKIAGEGTTEGSYSAANIRTEMVGDDLIIKMAESPEFTSVLVGSSGPGTGITINSEGLAIAGGPSITTGGIDAAGNWISNVKAGEKDTDAVNVSQLNTLADTPLTFAANQGDDVKRKLGETMKIAGEGTTEGSYSAANIRTEMVGDDLIIKMAESPEFTSVLVGSSGPGTGITINSEGLAIAGGPSITTGGIDAAGNWISNVKAGEKDTDAVNVSQLNTLADTPLTFAANQGDDVKRKLGETMKIAGEGTTEGSYSAANIRTEMVGDDLIIKMAESPEFTSVLVGSSGPGTGITINSEGLAIAGGPSITTGGIDAAGNWISNVKAGEKDTDAVNVSQLNTLADTPLTFAANQGDDVKRKLGETMKIAGEGTTEGSYSAANIRTEMVGDDLIIKMAESPEFTSVLVGSSGPGTGITINSEGLAIAGGPSITTGGIDAAGNWISNVKAGEKDTDAVNVSQLNTLADTPLTFAANQGDDVKRKLGETMKIAGEGTTEGSYSAANIRTEMVGDDLIIKMAESPEFTSVLVGSTGPGTGITINSEGLAIAGGPSITTGGIDAAGNWISNVKAGEKDTDAVNVSQLNTLADTPLTFAANQGDDVKRKLGETMKIAGEGTTEGSYSAANIRTEMVGDDLIIKMAESPEFTSVLVGSTGPGTGTTINSEGLTIAGGPSITTGGIDAAGNWISNVKAGEKDTDAVNVSQLNNRTKYFKAKSEGEEAQALGEDSVAIGMGAVANLDNDVALGAGSVTEKVKGQASVKINGDTYVFAGADATSTVSVGSAGAERTISNVAAGELSTKSTDAVNGSQLFATNTAVENLNTSVGELQDSPLTFAANQGDDVKRKLGETMKIAGEGTTEGSYSAANIRTEMVGDDLIIKMAESPEFTSVLVGSTGPGTGTTINSEGLTIAGGPSITTGGIDAAGNWISNVKAGEKDTDAVNVSQLNNRTKYFKAKSEGEEAQALGEDSVAIGMGAVANFDNDVALGAGSVTAETVGTASETINGNSYAFAGADPTSTVSVGDVGSERTITNVAAGRLSAESTDAVNGSQLFATNTALGSLGDRAVQYDVHQDGTVNYNNITLGGDVYNTETHEGGTTITNVADGSAPSDAVNYSQLTETNNTIKNIYNKGIKYFHANSTGEDSDAVGLDSVAIGMGAVANFDNDVALGAGSVTAETVGTASETINGKSYAFAGADPTSTVSVGDVGSERTITNVAAGRLSAESTDAVNGSQLFATNTALGSLGDRAVQYDVHQDGTVNYNNITLGGDVYNTETHEGGTTITNVADGSAPSDAVNYSQLTETNNTIKNIYNKGIKYFHANSTGADSDAVGLDSVAIGMGAVANFDNDIALGAGSVTAETVGTASETINGKSYAFAGADPTSTVSVGSEGAERTITNVAAGRLSAESTDAVNGSQLFATNTALESLNTSIGGLQNDALLWDADKGAFSASHGDTVVNKITNVAAGDLNADSTDAVNGSQLYATNQQVESNTTNIAQNTQNISNLGDTVENIYTTGTKYFHANSTGEDSQALGLDSVAIGMGAVSNFDNDVALGAGSVTAAAVGTGGVTLNGTDYAFAGASPASTVSVGSEGAERTITNVAAGRLSAESTDAVNGSQLFATNTALENLNSSVGGLQNDALLWDAEQNAFSASHGDTVVNKITNVAAGDLNANSTDAVNGSQLYATNQQVESNTTNIAQNTQNISNLGDTVTTINEKGTKYFHANSTGADSQAVGLDSVAIGMGAVSNFASDVALGAGSVTAAAVGTDGVTLNGTDYAFAGASPTSTVSVGSEGAERTITNVAAGRLSETSTDAVNGSQLYATNTALESLNTSIGGLQNDALLWDPEQNAFSASHGDTVVNKITNVAAGDLNANSTDAVNGSQLFATNQQVESNTTNIAQNTQNISNLGDTVTTINEKGTKYFHANSTGADSQALGLDSVAIGMGAVANFTNDVALGAGSVTAAAVGTGGVTLNGTDYAFAGASPASTVSVGSEGAERTITNVAAGRLSETSTDAVNGSQLYATNTALESLNTSIGGLQNDALLWDAEQNAFSASHGDTVVNKITNVAAGDLNANSTDAVNGSQLFATNQQVESNTTNIAQNTQNISNLGDTVTTINEKGTKYFHANSTGADSQAIGLDSVAIGMGAVANFASDVALGAGSVTAAAVGTGGVTLHGTDYAFAGASPASTVSVGSEGAERTITNVAAGRLSETSTDAVNGSQLYATNTAVENIYNGISDLQQDALQWDPELGAYSASHGDTVVNKITNVAKGDLNANSTDAVNGSQLFATNQQVEINTTNIAKNTQDITNLGDTVENIYTTGIKYFHANSTGADSQALGLDSVAIGMGAVANNAGDIALGAGSMTEAAIGTSGVTLRGNDYAFAGASPTSTVSVGSEGAERTITHVAAGRLSATSTDAVNGSQLYATNTALENIVINVDGLKGDALLWDESLGAFSASHGTTTVNKITNVAAGDLNATSTDAVNGSQLYATNQKVENLDYRVTNIEETVTNTVLPTMRYLKVNSSGPDAVASGADAIALGQSTVASGDNSIATGNGAQASGNGAIATGNNASASGTGSVAIGDNASVTASNSVALGSGSVADRDNTVSVGSKGNERQITNVAAGTEDTDAVNVAQLKDATGNISNDVTNISNGKDGMFQVNNTSNHAKPVVTGSDAVAGGAGSSASGSNSMAIGTKSSASAENSVALGNGSSATAKNSVALGAGSVASRENTVSVGYAGSERQITNVAAGTADTDAVNVSQLKQGMSESVNYTNKQFNQLKNMVNDQKDKLSAGIAGAMAMSSLPQPYSAGASMVGLGGGTYQGQSAVALGVSTISDNGKWVTKLSGTANSQGDFGAAIGVGYQW